MSNRPFSTGFYIENVHHLILFMKELLYLSVSHSPTLTCIFIYHFTRALLKYFGRETKVAENEMFFEANFVKPTIDNFLILLEMTEKKLKSMGGKKI